MNFWDQQFATPDFKYGTQANWFVRNQAVRLHAGSGHQGPAYLTRYVAQRT